MSNWCHCGRLCFSISVLSSDCGLIANTGPSMSGWWICQQIVKSNIKHYLKKQWVLLTSADLSVELAVFNASQCCQVYSVAKVRPEPSLTIMACFITPRRLFQPSLHFQQHSSVMHSPPPPHDHFVPPNQNMPCIIWNQWIIQRH